MIFRILGFLLFRPAGLMILGVLFMGMGAISIVIGHRDLPERAALKEVSGILEEARKVERRRRGRVSISYELDIKSEGGRVVKLTLAQEEITEEAVRVLLGHPVTALFSRDDLVWELALGAMRIVDYEATRRREAETRASLAEVGPYVAGGGFLVSLLGFWLRLRRRRAAEATA